MTDKVLEMKVCMHFDGAYGSEAVPWKWHGYETRLASHRRGDVGTLKPK